MDAVPPRTAWRVRRETAEPTRPNVENLIEPGVDAIPVRIAIVQNDFVTGWDEGALGFDEDAIWFSGESTSFRVVASDVRSRRFDLHEVAKMSVSRILAHGLPLAHPTRDVRVRFAMIPVSDRKDWEDEELLARELRRLWLLDGVPGESEYPPLVPRPGAKVMSWQEWTASRSFDWLPETIGEVGKLLFAGQYNWLTFSADGLIQAIAEEEGIRNSLERVENCPGPVPSPENRSMALPLGRGRGGAESAQGDPRSDVSEPLLSTLLDPSILITGEISEADPPPSTPCPPRAVWRVKTPSSAPPPPSLDGLLEDGTDALPVRIFIVQDEIVTGWDDGALGFDDAAVWFSGRATSFRITASNVLPGRFLLSRTEAVTDGEALNQGLPLRHPDRDVWLRATVLTEGDDRKASDEARLAEGIKRIRAAGGGGESEYPPLIVRPGMSTMKTPRVGLLILLGAGAVSTASSSFAFIVVLDRPLWGLLALLIFIVLSIILAFSTTSDDRLRRFRRDE